MDVCLLCVLCWYVEVSATGRPLGQRSPTEFGVSNWVWPRILDNDEAMAHWGCRAMRKNLSM